MSRISKILEKFNYYSFLSGLRNGLQKIDKVKAVRYYEKPIIKEGYIEFKVGSLDTMDYQLYIRNNTLYLGNDRNNKIYLEVPVSDKSINLVLDYVNKELY